MAGSIKGIIVEIGGDTSGLQKAISKVNSATSRIKRSKFLIKVRPKKYRVIKSETRNII